MAKPTAFSTDKNGITYLPTQVIRTDAGTQHRPALDEKAVEDYAQQMRDKEWNWKRSPIRITKEGDVYWMIGGFHRLAAAERADLKLVGCVVQPGTRRDAILASFSENRSHGVRLDNASKRSKVTTLLADEEWRTWSDNIIAKRCGVSPNLVGKVRVTMNIHSDSGERTYVNKQGGVSKMGTSAIGKRSEKSADSHPADQPKTLADLDPNKWYPVKLLENVIAFDPFETIAKLAVSPQYPTPWSPVRGDQLQNYPQYGEYKVVAPAPYPGVPASWRPAPTSPQPADDVAAPATIMSPAATQSPEARTYPTGVRGKVIDDKYYPVIMRRGDVHDEAFDDPISCGKCPRYPGNRAVVGRSLNHQQFYATFRLVAPVAKVTVQDAPASAPEPACRMIYETNDRFVDFVATFEEQFILDLDFWAEELSRPQPEPTQMQPSAGAPEVVGQPSSVPTPPPAPARRVQDDKWYMVDNNRHLIRGVPYDTEAACRKALMGGFYRVDSGENINNQIHYERWTIQPQTAPSPFAPTNGSGLHEKYSNTGGLKDTPVSQHEAQAVAASQAGLALSQSNGESHPMWTKPLDFRSVVDEMGIDEMTFAPIAKSVRACVIELLNFAVGNIDSKAAGAAFGIFAKDVNEHLKASQTTTA